MKVLIAAHSGDLAGAERDVLELAAALRAMPNITVEVVVPRPGALLDALRRAGVPARTLRSRWWATNRGSITRRVLFPAVNLVAVPRAAQLVRTSRPDVVVSFSITMPTFALAARAANTPHVWVARETQVEEHGFTFHFGTDRSLHLVDSLSTLVAVPSDAVATWLSRWVDPAKLRVLRYSAGLEQPGFEFGPHIPPASESPVFRLLFVGTLRESKGPADAIDGVGVLRAKGVPASLTVVGDGEDRYVSALRDRASARGVADAVSFVGEVPDAGPFYAGADVLLVCSRVEAYPRVVVEAMKRGIPVVATATGGSVEQVNDSGGGLLYEPGDVRGMAGAVERLYEDPELRRRLGESGRAWATASFTLERLGQEFVAIAEEALAASHVERPS